MTSIKYLSIIVCVYLMCTTVIVKGHFFSAFTSAVVDFAFCRTEECCDEWIHANFTGLAEQLNSKLYGQNLVVKSVVRHLKGHHKGNSRKALALSFHGWTGTGKNFVARIIAENMYIKGMSSKNVKLISATKEFPHEEKVPEYKDWLRDLIESSVRQCEKTMFIFDDMELITGRQSLYSLGATGIAEETVNYWKEGKKREDIKLKDKENIIQKPALNVKSGLWHSELITKHMITAYIPFLPLERKHVKECIRDGLIVGGYYKKRSEIPEDKVTEILDELTFYTEGAGIFSTTGCKRVLEKIDYVMEEA